MDGIGYPVNLKDIDKFEKQNPTISITVFGYKEKGVDPLRNSDNMVREHKIVLMLIEKDGVKHYCLVKILVVYYHHKPLNIMEKNIFV